MRCRFLLLFICLYSVAPARAQTLAVLLDSAKRSNKVDNARSLSFAAAAYQKAGAEHNIQAAGDAAYYCGIAQYLLGKKDDALAWYLSSQRAYESIRDSVGLLRLYCELIIFYNNQQKPDKAKEAGAKALHLAASLKNESLLANACNNTGLVYLDNHQTDSAVYYFRQSLRHYSNVGDRQGAAYALEYLAEAAGASNNLAAALAYIKQSMALRRLIKDNAGLAYAQANIGETLLQMHQVPAALLALDTALGMAQAQKLKNLEVQIYETQARAYAASGNFKKAFAVASAYNKLHDTLLNAGRIKAIEELQTQYGTAEKEQQNILLRGRNQLQAVQLSRRMLALIGSGVVILLLIISGWLYYNRYRLRQRALLHAEILHQQELATKAILEAEESERERIAKDLHDGVGQMMSAAKMNLSAFENDIQFRTPDERLHFERIINLVDDSCKEVRAVSHNMMPNALLKNSLAAAIREFIHQIDQRQLKVQLYTEGLDQRLDINTEAVLYRIIQECVNNVIKHAKASQLDISLVREGDELTATIEDNGQGFIPSQKEEDEGIGLRNIRTRVGYLKGSIDIDSAPGKGTVIALHLPLPRQNTTAA